MNSFLHSPLKEGCRSKHCHVGHTIFRFDFNLASITNTGMFKTIFLYYGMQKIVNSIELKIDQL